MKCTRGAGRDAALKWVCNTAKNSDILMYADFDTIYKKPYIDYIKKYSKIIKDDEVVYLGNLATKSTNLKYAWYHLNNGEDWERLARMKSSGVKILGLEVEKDINKDRKNYFSNKYFDNDSSRSDQTNRERRYARNNISLFIRLITLTIDLQRGQAFKSFNEFYSQMSKKKTPTRLIVYLFSYYMAKILGIYSYNPKLNNPDYILKHS